MDASEEGDEAFAAMVERQAKFLYQVAYAVVRDAQEAEDTVQATFLKLYRTGGWRRMNDERAFLARCAWRMAVDRLPRPERRMESSAEVELVSHVESPEQSSVRRADEALLRRLIDCLPLELREPLLLCALEEMTSRDVAVVMGIPEGTVRTRLMRAKSELRSRYAALGRRSL